MNTIRAIFWTIIILAIIATTAMLSIIIVPIMLTAFVYFIVYIVQQDLSEND